MEHDIIKKILDSVIVKKTVDRNHVKYVETKDICELFLQFFVYVVGPLSQALKL